MILIADGGSTKTNWRLINERGEIQAFKTEGYNPFYVDSAYIKGSLSEAISHTIDCNQIDRIFYYGAGVHDHGKAQIVNNALKNVFPCSEIEVAHDLLGAARALLGHNSGFVGILGTGTNTCIYDGDKIVSSIE